MRRWSKYRPAVLRRAVRRGWPRCCCRQRAQHRAFPRCIAPGHRARTAGATGVMPS